MSLVVAQGGEPASDGKPLHAARIEDYALIGDLQTAALVCKDGSLDWLCWPTFSSGACFAALLGTEDHGYWKIKPAATEAVTAESWCYRQHTLIVEKTWTTECGEVLVQDFMPPRGEHSDVVRIVRGVRGTVAMRMNMIIRFDYGRRIPWVTRIDHHIRAVAGPDLVVLRTPATLQGKDMETFSDFEVREGECVPFILSYGSSMGDEPKEFKADDALRDTETYWSEWAAKLTYDGPHRDAVERSLMTLKAMTYQPSGGLVAAVTTSLPEAIGAERNWDYRYCWLRDMALSLLALLRGGYTEEALAWRGWLMRAIAGSPAQIQSVYGLNGERQLQEWSPKWLPGYENSRPVRIGNAAAEQLQLDAYGELIAALAQAPSPDDGVEVPLNNLMADVLDHLSNIWQQPDKGIWEVRGDAQQFVHSKIMAWSAFDRSIKLYERNSTRHDAAMEQRVARWRRVRERIHAEVCEKGFDRQRNTFMQAYGSKHLDAALLLALHVGFLASDDPRMIGTVHAIERELMRDGLLVRYDMADGLRGREGAFLPCSFWLAAAKHLIGETDLARELFDRLLGLSNELGLLSEEYDVPNARQLGNFPQAFTHLALSQTAMILNGLQGPWTEARVRADAEASAVV